MAKKGKPVTFAKGMNSDNDPRYQMDGTYRDALNVEIINEDGTTFSLQNIKGNQLILDILNTIIVSPESFEEQEGISSYGGSCSVQQTIPAVASSCVNSTNGTVYTTYNTLVTTGGGIDAFTYNFNGYFIDDSVSGFGGPFDPNDSSTWPTISISPPPSGGVQATAHISQIALHPETYTFFPTGGITIGPFGMFGSGNFPNGIPAYNVTQITIDNPGEGYLSPPVLTFTHQTLGLMAPFNSGQMYNPTTGFMYYNISPNIVPSITPIVTNTIANSITNAQECVLAGNGAPTVFTPAIAATTIPITNQNDCTTAGGTWTGPSNISGSGVNLDETFSDFSNLPIPFNLIGFLENNIVGYYSHGNKLILIVVALTQASTSITDYRTVFLEVTFSPGGNISEVKDLRVCFTSEGDQHPNLEMDKWVKCQVEGIVENDCINRIYWTDNKNSLRTVNLLYSDLHNLEKDELDITPKAQITQPVLDDIITGTLPVGVYQYTFKYITETGGESSMSPLSNMIHISDKPSSSYKAYYGGPKGVLSGDGIRIKMYDLDTDFHEVEIYALLWEDLDVPPVVARVGKKTITGSSITVNHSTFENIIENGLEDILIRSNTWDVCKDIAIKDNILFAANLRQKRNVISEKEWNVKTLRYNRGGSGRLCNYWNGGLKDYKLDITGDVVEANSTNGAISIPLYFSRHDGAGSFNSNGTRSSGGAHRWLKEKIVDPNGGDNKRVLGAESIDYDTNGLGGCRITFKLNKRNADNQVNNGGAISGDTTYINTSTQMATFRTDNIASNASPPNNDINSDMVYKATMSLGGSKDPQVTGSTRGYQRGETYRFGVLVYDLNGDPGNVLWIGDMQMPLSYDIHYELDEDNHVLGLNSGSVSTVFKQHNFVEDYRLSIHSSEEVPNSLIRHYDDTHYFTTNNNIAKQKTGFTSPGGPNEHYLFDLHLNFEFKIPQAVRDKISGFRVVRAERNEEDRSILQQGIYTGSQRYGVSTTASTSATTLSDQLEERRADGYRDDSNLTSSLGLDHIKDKQNSNPVSPIYDDVLNQYVGLAQDTKYAHEWDDTNNVNKNMADGDAGTSFGTVIASNKWVRNGHGGSYEFGFLNASGNYSPNWQHSRELGTIDSPDSLFGIRPYIYRDGDILRIDSVLKLHNEEAKDGDPKRDETETDHSLGIKFSGIKETDTKNNSGVIINKYSVYDTYYPTYNRALRYMSGTELVQKAYSSENWNTPPSPTVTTASNGNNIYAAHYTAMSTSITNAKEILDGEIITDDYAIRDNYKGWSNHSLGFDVWGSSYIRFGVLDDAITSDDVNYENISTIQVGTRSIFVRHSSFIRIRNIKRILANETYTEPQRGAGTDSQGQKAYTSHIPYKFLVSIVRQNTNRYGGGDKDAIENTVYIPAGNFHPVEGTSSEEHLSVVAGGDTFVTFYSHQKTISPFKQSTYSTWECFPVETYVNTDMRSGLHLAAGDTEEGFDTDTPPFSNDWLYNPVYSQENNLQRYLPVKERDCEFTELPYEIAYSNTKLSGEDADAFRVFPIFNFHDVEGAYGQINRLINFQNDIYYLQDRGFGKLLVNPRTFLTDQSSGTDIFTGTGETIESHVYISTKYGTRHMHSVGKSENSLYFVDADTYKIIRYSANGIEDLSATKGIANLIKTYIQNNTTLLSYSQYNDDYYRVPRSDMPLRFSGISAGYDAINRQMAFTFANTGLMNETRNLTIAFDENIDSFVTRYNVYPQMWIEHMNKLFTTRRRVNNFTLFNQNYPGSLELWEWKRKTLRTHFFGRTPTGIGLSPPGQPTPDRSFVEVVFNDAVSDNKKFDNIQIVSNTPDEFNLIEYSTDINQNEAQWLAVENLHRYREGILRTPLRTENSTGRMRGTYLITRINANTLNNFNIFALLVKYRKSFN